jgi:hypothetical protein
VAGEGGPQPVGDERLSGAVKLGDEVNGRTFGFDLLLAAEAVQQHRSRVAGDGCSRVENCVEVHNCHQL